jgi:DNA-binding transcriptional ArsR family regulator
LFLDRKRVEAMDVFQEQGLDLHFHTLQSVEMNPEPLQPSLWRTCRVLANVTRLQLFAQLTRKQPQSVSQLAEAVALTMPVASQSLRALEARGLLTAKRIRRRVEYRIPSAAEAGGRADLIAALQITLRSTPVPTEQVMKIATAFTHVARVEIVRALASGPKTQEQLQSLVRLSAPAVSRHLSKLSARGFVCLDEGTGKYEPLSHPHAVGQALVVLVQA